jgi:hypothetical protein
MSNNKRERCKMEMRKENVSQFGQDVKKTFKEFKEFLNNTRDGVALTVNNEEDEALYMKREINKVYDIINENTIKSVSYIVDDYNLFLKKKATAELIDNTVIIVEVL